MFVGSPILERRNSQRNDNSVGMTADELHNARMGANLARILNPEYKIKDVVASIDKDEVHHVTPAATAQQSQQSVASEGYVAASAAGSTAVAGGIYTVKNARADAEIFRADSPVNRAAQAATAVAEDNEAESDDLRPTSTTIQYQTMNADGTVIPASNVSYEGEIERPAENVAAIRLSKRDKTVMGIIFGLIFAVFVLIIVNSAVISGLNSDIEYYRDRVDGANAEREAVYDEYNELMSDEHILQVAEEMGWLD